MQQSSRQLYVVSALITGIVLTVVGLSFGLPAFLSTVVLSALEITFSVDNAIINAKVLAGMPVFWRRMFLTAGVLIAVFGTRFILPILIVVCATGIGFINVVNLALGHPAEYALKLQQAHSAIAAFGGMFLLMVFLEFLLDEDRKIRWLEPVERPAARIAKWTSAPLIFSLLALTAVTETVGQGSLVVLVAGTLGILLNVATESLRIIFGKKLLLKEYRLNSAFVAGFASFLYLEVIDGSFSLDSVIGAFAITKWIPLIAVGLGIGALWVRTITLHIVRRRTLDTYRYLEHGARYAVGALAVILLFGIAYEIPDYISGLVGIVIILLALLSSWQYNRNQNMLKQI